MIGKLAIHIHKQKMVLTGQHLDQSLYHWSRRAVSCIPPDAERMRRCSLSNTGNILVDDVQCTCCTFPPQPIPCRRNPAQFLNVVAKERTALENHLEAIIIGGVVAAGYFDAAVNILQHGFRII